MRPCRAMSWGWKGDAGAHAGRRAIHKNQSSLTSSGHGLGLLGSWGISPVTFTTTVFVLPDKVTTRHTKLIYTHTHTRTPTHQIDRCNFVWFARFGLVSLANYMRLRLGAGHGRAGQVGHISEHPRLELDAVFAVNLLQHLTEYAPNEMQSKHKDTGWVERVGQVERIQLQPGKCNYIETK